MNILTGNAYLTGDGDGDVPHQEGGYASPGMHILIGNGMCLTGNAHPHREWDVPHREWGCASPGMGMCLTGNGDVPHREWGCASPGMGMCLTGNAHPHCEYISLLGMYIVYTGSAISGASDRSIQPPCIMCVQYREGVQYRVGCHEYRGDILSTIGGVQYRGGIP